ncbi:hypothetical protein KCL43_08015 [Streptococcus equi subsp. zooepidemicus]|uniref:hypothetical protein n=1 Tax=Streptococcus equi TaxID=1336 RepID=UPI001BAF8967|nr:hypothetical protein [Streptococcus equi]QUF62108.1 hypothetical protein KCL43_08015 [Streptococcus equi subsp. zooepidemicus]HEL0676271.1 hypothetical protein [Streptococcus equi subsp. zooepidemicus]HEL0797539.1 hypothetical protein [Streptococcus equi subsp. zooepidemicus]
MPESKKRKGYATVEKQMEANRRYREKNKEQTRIRSYFRTARSFIKNHATEKDLDELSAEIDKKRAKL